MIRQISIPTVFMTHQHEAQFIAAGIAESVARHEERRKSFNEAVQQAEKDLDTALNDGFKLFTQYEVKTDRHVEVVFILHKPNRGEYLPVHKATDTTD